MKTERRTALAVMAVLGTMAVATGSEGIGPEKKIIMVGPGMPTARSLRGDWRKMEKRTPFDGVAIYPATYKGGVATEALGRPFRQDWHRIEDFDDGIADLQAMKPRRFKHNFLHAYLTTGNKAKEVPDWFDDFDAVVNNWKVMAEYCKRSGLVGISFDDETYYGRMLWSYDRRSKYVKTKTAGQYADQAFLRGAQIMRAINTVYPDIHILSQHGPSTARLARDESGRLIRDDTANYALMTAFFEGLTSECTGKARIINGFLGSYGYRYAVSFRSALRWMKEKSRPLSRVPEKFDQHYQVAFQIPIGHYGTIGFGENPNSNFFTLDEFEYAVHQALKHADEYVMVNTGQDAPNVFWWSAPKGYVQIPQAYGDALLTARRPHPHPPVMRNLDAHAWTHPGSTKPPRKLGPPMSGFPQFVGYDERETFGDLWKDYEPLAELPHLWRFRIDPENIGLREQWFLPTTRNNGWFWITSELPWDDQGYRLYDGYGWYRQDFVAPRLPDGKKIYLAFGAVAHGAEVYVNGRRVGQHNMDGWAYGAGELWKKRFLIDVTGRLRGSQRNAIAVRVVDYGTFGGGIWKPVKLIAEK